MKVLLIALALFMGPDGQQMLKPIVVEHPNMASCKRMLVEAKAHPKTLLADCFEMRDA